MNVGDRRRRVVVVTGSASGIGAATVRLLEASGIRVVGVDRRDATVIADLSTAEGREAMVDGVRDAAPRVDAIVACAGVAHAGGAELIVRLNFFGAVATLEGLRPLLAASDAPRAVTVASRAVLHPCDLDTVDACLAGDEERAVAAALAYDGNVYACSKRALARWVRRSAPAPEWAGAGIPLNAVAPGAIRTPMIEHMLADREARRDLDRRGPMPLKGLGDPEDVAHLLVWLASPENTLTTGQVIFVDGGSDAVLRGDDVWG
jgi:NAD(P)-dependent dehydrogenase (short-subunit alcohol dehydrogenase family)